MEDNERCTVARGESGNGFKDTIFSSGGFTVRAIIKDWDWE